MNTIKLMLIPYNMKLIKSEKEYDAALEKLNKIFDADENTETGQEAELLALLIENYEEEYHKINLPDPIIAIRIRMEEMNLKQKDLIGIVGSKGIVSEVLNRKRRLTLNMIRKLTEKLNLTPSLLIQDYQLN